MHTIRQSEDGDLDALFDIWLAAVRRTHGFLAQEDVAFYAGIVRGSYLPGAALDVALEGGAPVGFMGMSGGTIDALFVRPDRHGRGIGRALVDLAARRSPVLRVDVNEQNPGARAFYARLGFREAGRSALDGAGRPYPLLHLVRGPDGGPEGGTGP